MALRKYFQQGDQSVLEGGGKRGHVGVVANADTEEIDFEFGNFFLPIGY